MSNSSEFQLDLGQAAVLRRLKATDLAAFQAYRSDPEVARYQDWEAMSDEAAAGFLHHMSEMQLFSVGEWTQIGIAVDGVLIGDIGVRVEPDLAEVGISLSRGAQGKGLAQKALAAIMAHLFSTTPITRIIGIADMRNHASLAMLERVGMARTKVESAMFKGELCDEAWFEIER